MVDTKSVLQQLKGIKFGRSIWNQPEISELPHILHDHETIEECVNGFYEGGVALLVATNNRVLLIDKKPLNFLTVEDLRFDMINEIDYSHRLMGASIIISTGSKTLKFSSLNQARLRRLISTVQERMSLIKKEHSDKVENQQQHLEEINRQLQMYLLAQHQHLQQQLALQNTSGAASANPGQHKALPKPDSNLADYLFAQRLLEQFKRDNPDVDIQKFPEPERQFREVSTEDSEDDGVNIQPAQTVDAAMVQDARREIFGKQSQTASTYFKGLEINPLRVAYSKLPMMLRNRKFGRPSFQAQGRR